MTTANETQVAGSHYRATVQHWDYVLQALNGRYLEGNITKYVTRHRKKNGLQDLQKAGHYLAKLIEEAKAGRVLPAGRLFFVETRRYIHGFCVSNGLGTHETIICNRAADWSHLDDLSSMGRSLAYLTEAAEQEERRKEAIKAGAVPRSE